MPPTYGTTAGFDELLSDTYPPSAAWVSYADEVTVHPALASNPDNGDDEDDDVDSLDAVLESQGCNFWYFTADHEARGGGGAVPLDPGDIYLANPVAGPGPVLAVDNSQLGLPNGTDVDAFELVLLEHPDMPGMGLYLAVLFSVDDDDLLTAVDESGGLLPEEVYVSFMDGMWFRFLMLDDDVDALTVYPQDPVKAPNLIPNPQGSSLPPEPPPDGTLPKTQNNVIYLVFDEAVAIQAGGLPVEIRELQQCIPEVLGVDEALNFTFVVDLATDPSGRTIKCKEVGDVLIKNPPTWYRIRPTVDLTNAAGTVAANMFVLDLCTPVGDTNGNGRVNTVDYTIVQAHIGERNDNRYDLNGNGRVNTIDYTVTQGNIGARKPPKP